MDSHWSSWAAWPSVRRAARLFFPSFHRPASRQHERIMNVKFPYGFDSTGSTAQDNLACHIRDMVEQILLTSPGERVNLPTFGSGTATLVFKPNSDALAAAQQQAVQASLQMWLSDLIKVQSVEVDAED